jgi:hypothetical protein
MVFDITLKTWQLLIDSKIIFDYSGRMLLAEKRSIEDLVAENLAKNPYATGPQLVAMVQKTRENTTKQAVYFALKSLMASEVVAKVGHTYFLSRVWLSKLDHLFAAQRERELARDAIFDLKDTESISYRFPNLLTCDTYWAHVFSILTEWIPKERPIYVWMPHEWFVIGRKEVETNIFREFEINEKNVLFTIGGTTPLDTHFKRDWKNAFVSVFTTDANPFARTYHLHVFEDFLIEVFISEELSKEIDDFYNSHQELTPKDVAHFESLISKKSPVRMKISRKSKKAALLRKRLAKQFYIPKLLRSD